MQDIFDAAETGDIAAVKSLISKMDDINQTNDYNFTALQKAATGSNTTDIPKILEVMELLIQAGSDLEKKGGGGRTALFLAAEFSPSIEPVKLLVEKGANPNVRDEYGNHIVVNAMSEEVQKYLSGLTGYPVPKPRPKMPKSGKLATEEWKTIKLVIDKIFAKLADRNLIVLQNAGTTQEDGFSDCAQKFHEAMQKNKQITGFCFYTKQDSARARKTGLLPLAIWGAPEGGDLETVNIGKMAAEEFSKEGFACYWDETAGMRPIIHVSSILSSKQ